MPKGTITHRTIQDLSPKQFRQVVSWITAEFLLRAAELDGARYQMINLQEKIDSFNEDHPLYSTNA